MNEINLFINLILIFIFAVIVGNFLFYGILGMIIDIRDRKLKEEDEEDEESDLPENNLVELVGEDEHGNGIYKIK